MRTGTAGQLAVRSIFPADIAAEIGTLDKKGVEAALGAVAERYPDQYRTIAKRLMDLGRITAYRSGGFSFDLDDLAPGRSTLAARAHIRERLADALDIADPEARRTAIAAAVDDERDKLTKDLFDESLAENNPFGLQVLSVSRGSPVNLRSLRGFDGAYEDHHGNRIPLPILSNYAEGLPPASYFAGTFGARKGVLDVKACLSGDTRVLMADFSERRIADIEPGMLVFGADTNGRMRPVRVVRRYDNGSRLCWYVRFLNDVTLVATPDHKLLCADGAQRRVADVVGGMLPVRLSGGARTRSDDIATAGEIPTFDLEVDHPDHMFVLANGLIVSNSGGVAGAGPVGFPLINQLMQVPEAFRGGAVHAQADGVVGQMRPAPQGGFYADIGGQEHYIAPEQELQVKPGDTVEAGDVLTDGIPNPAQIVKHKGIGEGRRYFVDAIREALRSAGTHVDRRNLEVLSRGLLDHVRVTGLFDDYAPDDVVPYHTIERNWQPRPGAVTVAPSQAVVTYLERPTLHYTIGTRVTKNMLPRLAHFGVSTLTTHKDPPPFEPEMQRAAAAVSTDPDWQVRMLGSGQKGSLLDATHRGAVSDEAGTSFVPAMIRGVDFGKVGPTTGW